MTARNNPLVSTRLRVIKPALALLTLVIAITLIAFTVRARWVKTDAPAKQSAIALQPTPGVRSYVQRARLQPQLRDTLKVLGDRLERPGKERLTLVGTLRRQNNPQAIPFRLLLELPRRMRLEEQGAQARVIGFDGSESWAVGATLSEAERGTIETLVFDSVEGFFFGQMQGFAMRALGTRFRLDDGTTPNYRGPFYDIYQVSDRIGSSSTARVQSKLFYFNSRTLLLERVSYQIERNSSPVKVEVQISGWQNANAQRIQTSITRLENGAPVLTLAIASAAISQRQNDGIFNRP
jgi:hypothetical protein